MSKKLIKEFSATEIESFVDDERDPEVAARIRRSMARDSELMQRIDTLNSVSDLIRADAQNLRVPKSLREAVNRRYGLQEGLERSTVTPVQAIGVARKTRRFLGAVWC